MTLILFACLLDLTFGDPVYRLHPVRLIGDLSALIERQFFARGWNGRWGGIAHGLLVISAVLAVWLGIRAGAAWIHPQLALLWDLYLAYSLLCLRDLLEQGRRVLRNLDDLPAARNQLTQLVGRDTAPLQRDGIVRATIESLAENLTDAVLTPLWALCLFGLPGLLAVKVISTLDSMIGYQNQRYQQFGWAAARSDDFIHWLPARLSVLVIALAAALLRLHPLLALRTAWRDHALLPSPNSGWSEAACAGALRVRLLGPVWRNGQVVNERFIGNSAWPADLDATDLQRALTLILVCYPLALALGLSWQ
ncbi:adenosylcobinamide-phosphate synthase CbiB [Chromatium okenii]|uniref:adenosylcobinamide-phosphate synthase CbiB n=1 Tax=Chromatium okenii TaxID=61644 RepID=UPI0026EA0AF8|nr:adenosylcobinamide-phosphate synthase CbiB [Chromatium okenii]MBV5310305.1 cobalamin biosynthesis protein CobD [Chromatium okenii]